MAQRFDVNAAMARFRKRLAGIASPNFAPLMVSFMKIITDDNRKGVLAGTDRRGVPMDPVKYRPLGGKGERLTKAQRNVANARVRRGSYAGHGPHAAGLHNNLTRREYERLGGPPLAPRGAYSRAITNLKTGWQSYGSEWEAYGYWDEVVSVKGTPFLHAHFVGASTGRGRRTRLPRRDLRGVRPEGMSLARKAVKNYMRDVIRGAARG